MITKDARYEVVVAVDSEAEVGAEDTLPIGCESHRETTKSQNERAMEKAKERWAKERWVKLNRKTKECYKRQSPGG